MRRPAGGVSVRVANEASGGEWQARQKGEDFRLASPSLAALGSDSGLGLTITAICIQLSTPVHSNTVSNPSSRPKTLVNT